jgi:hypothetical protein
MGKLTATKQGNISKISSNSLVWNLLGDELQCSSCDYINAETKGRCMKEELVHNHVSNHDNCKEDGKQHGNEFGTLRAALERQEAVHHWCCQKMH